MSKKLVWLLEHSKTPFRVVKEEKINRKLFEDAGVELSADPNYQKAVILEAPLIEFGSEDTDNNLNENDRWYSKQEYLDEAERMQPEIEMGALFGSPDHPDEGYSVSMKEVSHMITKLWYNEEDGRLWVRIKLLPTIKGGGYDLIVIHKNGGLLQGSARAVGFYDEDTKKATLDQFFTVDIVSNAGFQFVKFKEVVNANDNQNIAEMSETDVKLYESSMSTNRKSKNSINLNECVSVNFDKYMVETYNHSKETINSITNAINSSKELGDGIEMYVRALGVEPMETVVHTETHGVCIQTYVENTPSNVEIVQSIILSKAKRALPRVSLFSLDWINNDISWNIERETKSKMIGLTFGFSIKSALDVSPIKEITKLFESKNKDKRKTKLNESMENEKLEDIVAYLSYVYGDSIKKDKSVHINDIKEITGGESNFPYKITAEEMSKILEDNGWAVEKPLYESDEAEAEVDVIHSEDGEMVVLFNQTDSGDVEIVAVVNPENNDILTAEDLTKAGKAEAYTEAVTQELDKDSQDGDLSESNKKQNKKIRLFEAKQNRIVRLNESMKFSDIVRNFFNDYPDAKKEYSRGKVHNDYSTDTRVSFSDYVDFLQRNGDITEKQADNVTIKWVGNLNENADNPNKLSLEDAKSIWDGLEKTEKLKFLRWAGLDWGDDAKSWNELLGAPQSIFRDQYGSELYKKEVLNESSVEFSTNQELSDAVDAIVSELKGKYANPIDLKWEEVDNAFREKYGVDWKLEAERLKQNLNESESYKQIVENSWSESMPKVIDSKSSFDKAISVIEKEIEHNYKDDEEDMFSAVAKIIEDLYGADLDDLFDLFEAKLPKSMNESVDWKAIMPKEAPKEEDTFDGAVGIAFEAIGSNALSGDPTELLTQAFETAYGGSFIEMAEKFGYGDMFESKIKKKLNEARRSQRKLNEANKTLRQAILEFDDNAPKDGIDIGDGLKAEYWANSKYGQAFVGMLIKGEKDISDEEYINLVNKNLPALPNGLEYTGNMLKYIAGRNEYMENIDTAGVIENEKWRAKMHNKKYDGLLGKAILFEVGMQKGAKLDESVGEKTILNVGDVVSVSIDPNLPLDQQVTVEYKVSDVGGSIVELERNGEKIKMYWEALNRATGKNYYSDKWGGSKNLLNESSDKAPFKNAEEFEDEVDAIVSNIDGVEKMSFSDIQKEIDKVLKSKYNMSHDEMKALFESNDSNKTKNHALNENYSKEEDAKWMKNPALSDYVKDYKEFVKELPDADMGFLNYLENIYATHIDNKETKEAEEFMKFLYDNATRVYNKITYSGLNESSDSELLKNPALSDHARDYKEFIAEMPDGDKGFENYLESMLTMWLEDGDMDEAKEFYSLLKKGAPKLADKVAWQLNESKKLSFIKSKAGKLNESKNTLNESSDDITSRIDALDLKMSNILTALEKIGAIDTNVTAVLEEAKVTKSLFESVSNQVSRINKTVNSTENIINMNESSQVKKYKESKKYLKNLSESQVIEVMKLDTADVEQFEEMLGDDADKELSIGELNEMARIFSPVLSTILFLN